MKDIERLIFSIYLSNESTTEVMEKNYFFCKNITLSKSNVFVFICVMLALLKYVNCVKKTQICEKAFSVSLKVCKSAKNNSKYLKHLSICKS